MILDYKKIMDQNLDFFDDFFTNLPDSHHTKSQTGEHYKLLKYISNLYDDITILDLGTNTGESAIALSQNKKNKVTGFNRLHFYCCCTALALPLHCPCTALALPF
jgi:tRNA1(Val) A37 N6-methylase TrmN6